MPVDGPLPKTGDQQDIDSDANRCLWARAPRNWRLQNLAGTDDYGFDYQVQTTPNQQATDIFRLQLKGTRSPEISADRAYISITLKASTVRYYDRAVEPVLLVIFDLSADPKPSECPMYYVWVRAELHRINIAELPAERKYVTLRAPLSNCLTEDTDLSEDIRYQNEVSRVGYALSSRAEQTHPDMQTEDRLNLVQGVMKGVAARSATFMNSLAASTEQHWVAPSPGTLAWNLNQAKADLSVNALERATNELNIAESKLEQATDLNWRSIGVFAATGKLSLDSTRLQAWPTRRHTRQRNCRNTWQRGWKQSFDSGFKTTQNRFKSCTNCWWETTR